MNSLQVNLENIHTNSHDLPYGFTTGEQLLDQRSTVHDPCVEVFTNSFFSVFNDTSTLGIWWRDWFHPRGYQWCQIRKKEYSSLE